MHRHSARPQECKHGQESGRQICIQYRYASVIRYSSHTSATTGLIKYLATATFRDPLEHREERDVISLCHDPANHTPDLITSVRSLMMMRVKVRKRGVQKLCSLFSPCRRMTNGRVGAGLVSRGN
ncbi:hypothetical protein EYF80_015036 [Liparis tanakae]|uniref:Uncharacterized protein n=1 Tax=Liparis tanakae TaxID=230148 RepID=A0A4Z2I9S5_9TELE|nr:hypothetical protein EYF80_015036 [Liparis tanakae]